MAKINFTSFKKMNIENIGTSIDCIEMPLAYVASKYDTSIFYYYIFASYINRVWQCENRAKTFIENCNSIFNEFSLCMNSVEYNSKEDLLKKIKKSINEGNPIFLLFDYYEMFYVEDHYKRNHIPHGVIISGYDDERQVFILQESAHMHFTSLYPLQLTYDIVFKILDASRELIEKRKYFQNLVFSFKSVENKVVFSSVDFLKKYIKKIMENKNSLKEEIKNFDWQYLERCEGMASFKRKFSSSNKVFFDFLEIILKFAKIQPPDEYYIAKNEYLNFYEMLTSKIIKSYIKKEKIECEKTTKSIEKIDQLDNKLYKIMMSMLEEN